MMWLFIQGSFSSHSDGCDNRQVKFSDRGAGFGRRYPPASGGTKHGQTRFIGAARTAYAACDFDDKVSSEGQEAATIEEA